MILQFEFTLFEFFQNHVIQSLKRSTFPLERRANGERTVSERWVNGERTLNERWANAEGTRSERWTQVGERYVNAERWANAERANASEIWTVNTRWTFYLESLENFPCIVLNPNLVRIYIYELFNLVILFKHDICFLYKRTAWNRNYL